MRFLSQCLRFSVDFEGSGNLDYNSVVLHSHILSSSWHTSMMLSSKNPGSLSSLQTTPASSSWVQSLLPHPRDTQFSMLFSELVHIRLSSQILPAETVRWSTVNEHANAASQVETGTEQNRFYWSHKRSYTEYLQWNAFYNCMFYKKKCNQIKI